MCSQLILNHAENDIRTIKFWEKTNSDKKNSEKLWSLLWGLRRLMNICRNALLFWHTCHFFISYWLVEIELKNTCTSSAHRNGVRFRPGGNSACAGGHVCINISSRRTADPLCVGLLSLWPLLFHVICFTFLHSTYYRYFSAKDLRSFAFNLVLWMAVSDLFKSFANLIGSDSDENPATCTVSMRTLINNTYVALSF